MNKYIKTDLEQAKSYMSIAINNALHDIDSGEEKIIDLGKFISVNLLAQCLEKNGWDVEYDENYNGWEMMFWWIGKSPSGKSVTIEGSLFGEFSFIIKVNDNE